MPSSVAPPNYPSGLPAFRSTALYPAHVIPTSMDHLSLPQGANDSSNHVPSSYMKGEHPHSPSATNPHSSSSTTFSSVAEAVESVPPGLSQQLLASAVAGGGAPASSGMIVADHGSVLNGEYFGAASMMPGLVAAKPRMLGSGAVLYNTGLFQELSSQSTMTNPSSSSSTDTHCLSVAH